MTECEIRDELSRIASRFGPNVSPDDIPEEIVRDYAHGLSTGMWLLKVPRDREHRLVVRAIAGINAAVESQSVEELDEAGRVLLGAVMQAMGSRYLVEQTDRIVIRHRGDEIQIVVVKSVNGRPRTTSVVDSLRLNEATTFGVPEILSVRG